MQPVPQSLPQRGEQVDTGRGDVVVQLRQVGGCATDVAVGLLLRHERSCDERHADRLGCRRGRSGGEENAAIFAAVGKANIESLQIVVCRFLEEVGRQDKPVAAGEEEGLQGLVILVQLPPAP